MVEDLRIRGNTDLVDSSLFDPEDAEEVAGRIVEAIKYREKTLLDYRFTASAVKEKMNKIYGNKGVM